MVAGRISKFIYFPVSFSIWILFFDFGENLLSSCWGDFIHRSLVIISRANPPPPQETSGFGLKSKDFGVLLVLPRKTYLFVSSQFNGVPDLIFSDLFFPWGTLEHSQILA